MASNNVGRPRTAEEARREGRKQTYESWRSAALEFIEAQGRGVGNIEMESHRKQVEELCGETKGSEITLRRGLYNAVVGPDSDKESRTKDNQRRTALHWAAMLQDLEIVTALLKAGVKTDDKDTNGRTPLHYLCDPMGIHWIGVLEDFTDRVCWDVEERIKCAKELIKNIEQENLDAVDEKGQTALILACRWTPEEELVKCLKNAGADLEVKDSNGKTALVHAKESRHYKCAEVLSPRGVFIVEAESNDSAEDTNRRQLLLDHQTPDFLLSKRDLVVFLNERAQGSSTEGRNSLPGPSQTSNTDWSSDDSTSTSSAGITPVSTSDSSSSSSVAPHSESKASTNTRRARTITVNLLGYAGVGKSSLVKSLEKDSPGVEEKRTQGINIGKCTLKSDSGDFRLVMYDFDGKATLDLMHYMPDKEVSINFVFLNSDKLVLNSGKLEDCVSKWFDDEAKDWLELARTRSPASALAYVVSKCDKLEESLRDSGNLVSRDDIFIFLERKIEEYGEARKNEIDRWTELVRSHSSMVGDHATVAIKSLKKALGMSSKPMTSTPFHLGLTGKGSHEFFGEFKSDLKDFIEDHCNNQWVDFLPDPPPSWDELETRVIEKRKGSTLFLDLKEVEELAESAGVEMRHFQKCLTYLKVKGVIIQTDPSRHARKQVIFHNPKALLVSLGHIHDFLKSFRTDRSPSLRAVCDEGRIEVSALKSSLSAKINREEFDFENLLDLYIYFHVLCPVNVGSDGLPSHCFIPSLIERAKKPSPDLPKRWPKKDPEKVEYSMVLRTSLGSFPTGCFDRFRVISAYFTVDRIDWKDGFVAQGSATTILAECGKTSSCTLQMSVRAPESNPEEAQQDMARLYWACVESMAYYPGVLYTIGSFCDCQKFMFEFSECFTKPYKQLMSMECPKCDSPRVAADHFPLVIPGEIRQIHSLVRRHLRNNICAENAKHILDEIRQTPGLLTRRKHAELEKHVYDKVGITQIMDFLEEKRLFLPGRYTWICKLLTDCHLCVSVRELKRHAQQSYESSEKNQLWTPPPIEGSQPAKNTAPAPSRVQSSDTHSTN